MIRAEDSDSGVVSGSMLVVSLIRHVAPKAAAAAAAVASLNVARNATMMTTAPFAAIHARPVGARATFSKGCASVRRSQSESCCSRSRGPL